jgi:hypothetical protein
LALVRLVVRVLAVAVVAVAPLLGQISSWDI